MCLTCFLRMPSIRSFHGFDTRGRLGSEPLQVFRETVSMGIEIDNRVQHNLSRVLGLNKTPPSQNPTNPGASPGDNYFSIRVPHKLCRKNGATESQIRLLRGSLVLAAEGGQLKPRPAVRKKLQLSWIRMRNTVTSRSASSVIQ